MAALHGLIGYALVTGLGFQIAGAVGEELKVYDVPQEIIPPPVEVAPAALRTPEPEGAASPPNLVSEASPVVAPPPVIRIEPPPPVVAAPLAGVGSDRDAGAADRPGPGTGSGGIGDGSGSGTGGDGGGGGGVVRAQHKSGRIVDADYPRSAWRGRVGGTVVARFTVEIDGRASGCKVARSSGNPQLDATTCRLIEERFRYRPARDDRGRPVRDVAGWKQDWWLE